MVYRGGLKNAPDFGISLENSFSVWDPNREFTVDPDEFLSKGRATPLAGMQLCGRNLLTVHKGEIVYKA